MADTDTAETETPEEVYRPERKATLRLGQRELNRITLIVIAIIAAALLYAGYRGMQGFKAHRDVMLARDHLLALHKAMQGYALDWDGHLPPADHWMDSVSGYLSAPPNTPGGPKSYLHGPGDGETVGYVYNDLAAGYDVESGKDAHGKTVDPHSLVLLIERTGAPDNAHIPIPVQDNAQAEDELYKDLSFPHYAEDSKNATTVILYADGNIVTMIRQDFKQ